METKNKREHLQACILRVREGDQEAFGEILTEYTPLVQAEVSRHGEGLQTCDLEDLRQIALVALYRAALAYDLGQSEVEFGLYAKICIGNALVSHLRTLRRRVPEVPFEFATSQEERFEDPAARVMEAEAYAALYASIRRHLSPYENRVWGLFVAGRSAKEIAALLDRDTHSVENAVSRIRRKLRTALGDDVKRS